MKRQLLVLALMGTAPSLIWAQNEPDSTKIQHLEEITISAIRATEKAPVAQVTVQRAQIQKNFQGQDAAFLLERLSPSLVTYSESGTGFSNYGQMRLRGIDQTRINITLNGVPLNDMMDQGVFFSNFTDFGNSIESVQVQRGVGTSSNGVASYAGSVNFESISLTQTKPSTELQFTGGSFNTLRTSAEVQTGIMENRTSFYARMSHLQSDGYRYHSGTKSNSLFFSGGYFGDKHALKFTGFAGRTENDLAYTPVPLSLIEIDPRSNVLSDNDIDDFGQYLFQLQHTWRTGERSTFVNTLYFGGAGGDFPYSYGDTSSAVGLSTINYPLYNNHYGWLSNFNWNNKFGNWNFGTHVYTFQRENIEYMEPNSTAPYYQDQSAKDEFAAFVKWEKSFGPFRTYADLQSRFVAISLGGDAAYLGEDPAIPQRNYQFFNPKLGLTYNWASNWEWYASLGLSSREPTRTDILGTLQVNAFNIANVRDVNNVEAEQVLDLEFGSRWQNEQLSVDFNLFYMDFENEIAPIGLYIPEGFYQVYENQAPSFRRGAELLFLFKPIRRWSLQGQFAYLDARISQYALADTNVVYENVRPILSPEFNASLQISYEPNQKAGFSLRARYLSEQFMELSNDPSLVVPASLVLDFSARYNFYRKHELSLQVNNLSNQLYYTYGAPAWDGSPAYLVQAPINVYATLRLVF